MKMSPFDIVLIYIMFFFGLLLSALIPKIFWNYHEDLLVVSVDENFITRNEATINTFDNEIRLPAGTLINHMERQFEGNILYIKFISFDHSLLVESTSEGQYWHYRTAE